jgi:Flp pilus assembly protein TadD
MLPLLASVLAACSVAGGVGSVRNGGSEEAPSAELQASYAALVERIESGDSAAVADMERFSSAYPGLAGPLLNLGLARVRAGDESGAEALFQQATTVCARCGAPWNELGVLRRQQGRFTDAEQAYLRAIELEAGFAPTYYNLAMLYELYIPRPELAVQNYERYLQLDGGSEANADVAKWVADLRRRVEATPKAARAEGTS